VITDATVAATISRRPRPRCAGRNRRHGRDVPAGESSKSFAVPSTSARPYRGASSAATSWSRSRRAWGGSGRLRGCRGRRGLDYVQVPTTLLAQVDSSVGARRHRFQAWQEPVGAFHQPSCGRRQPPCSIRCRRGNSPPAMPSRQNTAARRCRLLRCLKALAGGVRGGPARERAIATSCRAKARSWRATSAKPATGRCSISATPSGMPSRRPPLFRQPACTRGDLVGMVLASSSPPARIVAGRRGREGGASPCGGRPADPSVHGAGLLPDADGLMELIAQDQEGATRPADLHPGARIGQAFVAPDDRRSRVRAFLLEKLAEREHL